MPAGHANIDLEDDTADEDPQVIAAMRAERPSTVDLIGASMDEGDPNRLDIQRRLDIMRKQHADTGARLFSFEGMIRPCLAEMMSLLIFTYVGCMAVATSQGQVLVVAFAHGLAIIFLIGIFGSISGAHINPVVSLGIFLAGEIKAVKLAFYIASQLVGSVLGAGLARVCLETAAFTKVTAGQDLSKKLGEALLTETMLTAILVLVVLMSAVDTKGKVPYAAISIGMTVTGNILAGSVSGPSMNPARSFGPALLASDLNNDSWNSHYVFWVGPTVGALLASALFRSLIAHKDRRLLFKSE